MALRDPALVGQGDREPVWPSAGFSMNQPDEPGPTTFELASSSLDRASRSNSCHASPPMENDGHARSIACSLLPHRLVFCSLRRHFLFAPPPRIFHVVLNNAGKYCQFFNLIDCQSTTVHICVTRCLLRTLHAVGGSCLARLESRTAEKVKPYDARRAHEAMRRMNQTRTNQLVA